MMFKRSTALLVLIFGIAAGQEPGTAQKSATPAPNVVKKKTQQKQANDSEQSVNPWLERARLLTQEVLDQDRPALKEAEVPALNIQLARIWWKQDPVRAKQWLDAAMEAVEHVPQNEKEEDRKARLQNATLLASVAASLGQSAIEDKMVALVKDAAAHETDGDKQRQLQENLGSALANSTRDTDGQPDPKILIPIAQRLLQLGDAFAFSQVEDDVRFVDSGKADELLAEAIGVASQQGTPQLFDVILQIIFPTFGQLGRVPPDPRLKQLALSEAVSSISKPEVQSNPDATDCRLIGELYRLESELTPPEKATVEMRMRQCPQTAQYSKIAPRPEDRSQDLLDRSAGSSDTRTRARGKITAAILAAQKENDHLKAIEILETMTDEEKKAAPQCENQWSVWAFRAIDKLLKTGDTVRAEEILEETPPRYRANLYIAYARLLKRDGDPNYAVRQLAKARESINDGESDLPWDIILLLNAYLDIAPDQSPTVLREVVAALNHLESCDLKKKHTCPFQLGHDLSPVDLSSQIMDLDPGLVRAAISDVNDEKARASLRLGLVRAALARYERERRQ